MKKRLIIGTLCALAIVLIAAFIILWAGFSITITENEIRTAVANKFPCEITHLEILTVTYSDPVVELIDNSNRVRVGLTATPHLEVNGKRYKGSAVVTGGFRYEAGLGQVFLTNFEVERLDIGEITGNRLAKLSTAVAKRLEKIYSKYPIYTLSDADLKQRLAKKTVREIRVVNKTVVIRMGW